MLRAPVVGGIRGPGNSEGRHPAQAGGRRMVREGFPEEVTSGLRYEEKGQFH